MHLYGKVLDFLSHHSGLMETAPPLEEHTVKQRIWTLLMIGKLSQELKTLTDFHF